MITLSTKDSQSSNASAANAADSRGEPLPHSEAPPTPKDGAHQVPRSQPPVATPAVNRYRKWFLIAGIAIAAGAAGYVLAPQLKVRPQYLWVVLAVCAARRLEFLRHGSGVQWLGR